MEKICTDIDTPSNNSEHHLLCLSEGKPMKKLLTISTLISSTFIGPTLADDRETKQQNLTKQGSSQA